MHEWALADAVITTAKKVAQEENLQKVTEIVVKIGELQTISREIFDTALQEVLKSAPDLFDEVTCTLEIEPAGF
ncbi:hydrogenase nickel insertion protein HypA, partial [bacterium]